MIKHINKLKLKLKYLENNKLKKKSFRSMDNKIPVPILYFDFWLTLNNKICFIFLIIKGINIFYFFFT